MNNINFSLDADDFTKQQIASCFDTGVPSWNFILCIVLLWKRVMELTAIAYPYSLDWFWSPIFLFHFMEYFSIKKKDFC